MPAFRAAKTLEKTYRDIPRDVVDEVLLVDDASDDGTVAEARRLGILTFQHPQNRGYGGNQKTCYTEALRQGADIVVMLHPDYQYEPKLITPMAGMVASGIYDVVLGSRILGNTAHAGGMPLYKYVSNRVLTAVENLLIGEKLSEYHTGYRAFSRRFLETVPFLRNSRDFVFDSEMLAQAVAFDFRIAEIPVTTKYFEEASSVSFKASSIYGTKTLWVLVRFGLHQAGLLRSPLFQP